MFSECALAGIGDHREGSDRLFLDIGMWRRLEEVQEAGDDGIEVRLEGGGSDGFAEVYEGGCGMCVNTVELLIF